MKNWKHYLIVCFMVIIIVFIGCGDDKNNDPPNDQNSPKDQIKIISIFNEASSSTVKGYMTNVEWNGVANKIVDKLNEWFFNASDEAKQTAKDVFARGVTYIVELEPNGYNNIKTIGDGKTIYIALSSVDTEYVVSAMGSINNYDSGEW